MNNKQRENFMKLALAEAQKSITKNEVPVGAVVTKNNHLISAAHNLTGVYNSLFHAEILAINQAFKILKTHDLINCKLFVTLEPCIMCTGAIINSRIGEVEFSCPREDDKSHFIEIITLIGANISYKTGLLKTKSKELIQEFFKKQRIKN